MNRYIFLIFIITSLSSCAIISKATGLYKLSGATSEDQTEGEPWIELTYHGKKSEDTKEAITKWHKAVEKKCHSKSYDIDSVSFFNQFLIPGASEYFKELMVYYPEDNNTKWPQVVALYRC